VLDPGVLLTPGAELLPGTPTEPGAVTAPGALFGPGTLLGPEPVVLGTLPEGGAGELLGVGPGRPLPPPTLPVPPTESPTDVPALSSSTVSEPAQLARADTTTQRARAGIDLRDQREPCIMVAKDARPR
jgi:hypothetical protein